MKAKSPQTECRVRASVIAEKYSVDERTVRRWAETKKIPSIRIGSTLRFDLAAVIAAIEGKPA